MRITLNRKYKGQDYTISHSFINGEYFCDFIEDRVRDLGENGENKVYGETAIPAGKYRIVLTYSPKFKRELPLLLNVPFFEGIRIYRGNTAQSSSGCLIPGENKIKGQVINSTKYEIELIRRIKEAISHNEEIWITIQ